MLSAGTEAFYVTLILSAYEYMNERLVFHALPWSCYSTQGHSTEHNHKQHMQVQDRTTLRHRLYEKKFASDSPVFLRFKRYIYSLLTSYTHAIRYQTTCGTPFMHHDFHNTSSCPFMDPQYRYALLTILVARTGGT